VPQCYAVFKAATQQMPTQFVTQRRLDWAEQLLATIELSVQSVAERTDFADPFYFSRVFSRARGLSPTAFRQARKKAVSEPRPFPPPTE
jgi:AraC-like DNA-binding protein